MTTCNVNVSHLNTHLLQVSDGQRGEVFQPVLRAGKLNDFLVAQTQAPHDVPLELGASGLGHSFALRITTESGCLKTDSANG